jgi:hypothetical protein
MSLASPRRLICVCAIVWLSATAIHAQDAAAAPAEPTPTPVTIADEPSTVDPAAFMPPQLAAAATVDFTSSSLGEILNWLREKQKLVVLVENDALAEVGVLPGDSVSDRLNEAPIYLLLNRLRSVGLAWYFEDGILHVTSEKVAGERLTTIPHNIGDLLDAGYEPDTLAQVIQCAVAPASWDTVGGAGVVSFLGDVMLVRQTDDLQREVRGLLAALRKHGRRTFASDPPQHSLLRKKLGQNVTVALRDTPLETALQQLAEKAQIDIRLDLPALREKGVRQRQPISLALADQKLKTVLQAMLIDADLTWILRDNVLWVTSRDKADAFLKTAVYDVRDLCRDDAESEALRDAITSQTSAVWSDVGGPGEMQSPLPGVLVVHNTESVLDQVLDLLETYRAALRSSKPRKRPEEDPNQVITVYYRMHAKTAEDLAATLPKLIRPESWRSEARPEAPGEVFLVASAPDLSKVDAAKETASEADRSARALVIARAVLIVRQTRAAHAEIEEVIRRVESGDASLSESARGMGAMGGMGGGFGGGFFSVPSGNVSE